MPRLEHSRLQAGSRHHADAPLAFCRLRLGRPRFHGATDSGTTSPGYRCLASMAAKAPLLANAALNMALLRVLAPSFFSAPSWLWKTTKFQHLVCTERPR